MSALVFYHEPIKSCQTSLVLRLDLLTAGACALVSDYSFFAILQNKAARLAVMMSMSLIGAIGKESVASTARG
jgi:hypothetical protein